MDYIYHTELSPETNQLIQTQFEGDYHEASDIAELMVRTQGHAAPNWAWEVASPVRKGDWHDAHSWSVTR